MKENLIHSRTCVYNINYHVVWSVKYRRKILSAEIEIYLKELVQKIASDKGFTVHLFEVGEGALAPVAAMNTGAAKVIWFTEETLPPLALAAADRKSVV